MQKINKVTFSKYAIRDLKKIPRYLVIKLQAWVEDVSQRGLQNVMKTRGYRDEALKGRRKNQRSIRLNKSYRAIYQILSDGSIEFIEVLEINKHEY